TTASPISPLSLHDALPIYRLEPVLAQRERGVDAAVVELDPLADPVRPRAEDHDLRPAAPRADLVLALVGRVVVRRLGLELGRARVDRLVDGPHAERAPALADLGLALPPQARELRVGEARPLELAEL